MPSKRELRTLARQIQELKEVEKPDSARFNAETEALAKEAETSRMRFMQRYQNRLFISLALGLLSLCAGGTAFGWYFLVEGDLAKAGGWFLLSLVLPVFLRFWMGGPLKAYERWHRNFFMPKMANALGGFRYVVDGGVSAKVLPATLVAPDHDRYETEDCFMGLYKGIKVIFSEARLYRKGARVFSGLFILLEIPRKIVDGQVIVTAHLKMAEVYGRSRWQGLTPLPPDTSNPDRDKFAIFSKTPEEGHKLADVRLLKELSEASAIFKKSPLTVTFFREKYIFIMVPHDEDMFEASAMQEALPTRQHATARKKEIEKLLEIIDVFDIYQAGA